MSQDWLLVFSGRTPPQLLVWLHSAAETKGRFTDIMWQLAITGRDTTIWNNQRPNRSRRVIVAYLHSGHKHAFKSQFWPKIKWKQTQLKPWAAGKKKIRTLLVLCKTWGCVALNECYNNKHLDNIKYGSQKTTLYNHVHLLVGHTHRWEHYWVQTYRIH